MLIYIQLNDDELFDKVEVALFMSTFFEVSGTSDKRGKGRAPKEEVT